AFASTCPPRPRHEDGEDSLGNAKSWACPCRSLLARDLTIREITAEREYRRGLKVASQSRIWTFTGAVRESNATLVPRLERHGPSPADQNHAPARRWPCPGGSHYPSQDETTQDAPADSVV